MNILTGEESMCCRKRLPEVIVFAGPNGSGKSTISKLARVVGCYINADDIRHATQCTALEAAQRAESMREAALSQRRDFTFETVLSTDRIFKKRKEQYFFWENEYWKKPQIENLVGMSLT